METGLNIFFNFFFKSNKNQSKEKRIMENKIRNKIYDAASGFIEEIKCIEINPY